jgi:hypothetical protein
MLELAQARVNESQIESDEVPVVKETGDGQTSLGIGGAGPQYAKDTRKIQHGTTPRVFIPAQKDLSYQVVEECLDYTVYIISTGKNTARSLNSTLKVR